MEIYEKGYLAIDSKEDRAIVAQILFNNGYTVFPAKKKKDGRANLYLVGYERRDINMKDGAE